MIYVRNDDGTYWWWMEANSEGFVANLDNPRKGDAMLHTTRCHHLYPRYAHEATYTDPPKVCSRVRDEVEKWVSANEYKIEHCKSCKPDQ